MNQSTIPTPPASNLVPDRDEFFVGYESPVPAGVARFVRRAVIAIVSGGVAWALALGPAHLRLEGGTFEFGHPGTFSGTIIESPVPALRPDGGMNSATSWPLLVAPGRHGAAGAMRGLAGRHVTLIGTRIARGAQTMIEIDPASIVAGPMAETIRISYPEAAPVRLRGEVVDSKCFLGVMVPGAGKTHKECAGLCLRGGIPPALFVQDRSGASRLLLVTGPGGEPLTAQAVMIAGEAIDLTGTISRLGGWLIVRTNPAAWRTVAR